MPGESLHRLISYIQEHGELAVDLSMEHTVVYSSLQGNYPINHRIRGQILGMPVEIRLYSQIVPNTMGSYPVNSRAEGRIGDDPFVARLDHRMVFSSIAGNIPVNTRAVLPNGFGQLNIPIGYMVGATRGRRGGGGAKKMSRKVKIIHKAGQMIVLEGEGGGGGSLGEANIPMSSGLQGRLGDIEIDLRFQATYFCNSSSGRTPINRRAVGVLRRA